MPPRRSGTPSPAAAGGARRSGKGAAPFGVGGRAAFLKASAANKREGGILDFAASPLRELLEAVSQPAYAVGDLIQGQPWEAAKRLGNMSAEASDVGRAFIPHGRRIPPAPRSRVAAPTTPGKALAEHGLLPKGGGFGGAALRFVADVGLDPLTYVTFGAGGAARAAAGRAPGRAFEETARAGAKNPGAYGHLVDVGRKALAVEQARAAVPRQLEVGVRVPFTRGKTKQVASSRAVGALIDKAAPMGRAGRLARHALLGEGTTDRALNQAALRVRGVAAGEAEKASRAARELERLVTRSSRAAGVSRQEGMRLVTLAAEGTREAPDVLKPAVERLRSLLDDLDVEERAAGIERGSISDYVPIRFLKGSERERYAKTFGARAFADLDNPAFVKPRVHRTVEEVESRGFAVEMNPAKLYELRAHESLRARMKKAVDEVTAEAVAVKPPPRKGPDVGEAAVALSQARSTLTDLSQRLSQVTPAKAALAPQREAADEARTLAALSAGHVGSPTKVASATRAVVAAQGRLAKRERRMEQVVAHNKQLAANPARSASSPEEWAQVARDWEAFPSKYFSDTRISAEDAATIQRIHERLAPRIPKGPKELDALRRGFMQFGARWKSLALLSPGFHMRNLFDDTYRAFVIADARSPASYALAARALAGGEVTVKARGRTWTREELISSARSAGAVDSHFAREVQEGMADINATGVGRRRVSAPGGGRLATGSRKVGSARENWLRLGTFIERLKAGDDVYEAGRRTREAHIDYGDPGRFVEASRKFFLPFVTYTSKSAALIGRQVGRRPGSVANYHMAMEELAQSSGNPRLDLLPVGARSSVPVPLPWWARDKLNVKAGDPVLYNPERTVYLGTANTLDPNQVQSQGLGLLSPFLSIPAQIWLDRNFRGAKPLAKTAPVPGFLRPIAKSLPGYKHKYGGPRYDSELDLALRGFPPFGQAGALTPRGDAANLPQGLLSYLAGVKLSPYDRQRAIYFERKRRDNR